jgi:excisionase family DNA binding protein
MPEMADVGIEALRLLTASEVALLLGRISVRKVRRLAAEGEIQKVKVGSLARYTPDSVVAYMKRLAEQAEAP